MPAAAVFRDPDNNLLEFITVLPYPPRRDLGVLSGVIGFAGSHRRLTPREFPLASFDLIPPKVILPKPLLSLKS